MSRDDIRLIGKDHDDKDEYGDERDEYGDDTRVRPVTGEILTLDDQLLERLERLEALLSNKREARVPTVRNDDFSLSTVSGDSEEEILIRVRDRLQEIEGGDLGEDISRALLSLLGASYGAQVAGPTGAGIGAAIASFLYSKKKVNPLEILLGKR